MKTLKVGPISKLTLLLLLGRGPGAGTNAYAQELLNMANVLVFCYITLYASSSLQYQKL
jgi:hypothetical protein